MGNDNFTIKGNVTGSVLGGRHGKVVVTNSGTDVESLRSELEEIRLRIESLDLSTPDRNRALEEVARIQAALDGDGDPQQAVRSVSVLERLSRGLGLALEVAKLGDHVHAWFG